MSVEKACRIHKVDAGAFVGALDRHVAGGEIPLPVVDAGDPRPDVAGEGAGVRICMRHSDP